MSRYTALDWYETPLYYDIVFSGDDATEGLFLLRLLELHGPPLAPRARRRVLEPACGSGRMVLELARRGCDVTGFDLSAAMLEFARRRMRQARRRAELLEARMESFEVGTGFDLAHCMVNTFKYLLDESSARAHLERVARALRPGGLYAIGIHLTQYEDRRDNHERWVARRGPLEVTCNIHGSAPDRRTRLENVRSRLRVLENGREQRTETAWTFRTYDLRQFRALVSSVPAFEIAACYDFGYDTTRPRTLPDDQLDTVFVLRKRARPELKVTKIRSSATRTRARG